MTKSDGILEITEVVHHDAPRVLIIHDPSQGKIVRDVADVLGSDYRVVESLKSVTKHSEVSVVGLELSHITHADDLATIERTIIVAHALDAQDCRDEQLAAFCDFEYLYTQAEFTRRDLARYIGFVLGQTHPHDGLKQKPRTTLLATTFPDIRTALPNLDILSVGVDAVEIRVDLLREPGTEDQANAVPSLTYVGEQFMLLRQRTELPILFTPRCVQSQGQLPMDHALFFSYLRKGLQWGCEYIDVEVWLSPDLRKQLARSKGNSKIISSWHDFSGTFKWTSTEAQRLFDESARHGDIVKLVTEVNSMEDNYELESFRSTVPVNNTTPLFSALNVGSIGRLSQTLNRVLAPLTHPLIPTMAVSCQLSAAEISTTLDSIGQMPRLDIYVIDQLRSRDPADFFEKCINELSLPHQVLSIERGPHGSIESLLARPRFGGAYINPPISVAQAPYLTTLSDAAAAMGQVDTVAIRSVRGIKSIVAENITWRAIQATLTTDFVPSAYVGRAALVVASAESFAAAAIYALRSLKVASIYTIGFKARPSLGSNIEQFKTVEDLHRVEDPFVIVSALPTNKSSAVSPILKHYSRRLRRQSEQSGSVFVDLSTGVRAKSDSLSIAHGLGWSSYGIADVNSWIIVETLRLLISQNVPLDFVRLAGGKGLCA